MRTVLSVLAASLLIPSLAWAQTVDGSSLKGITEVTVIVGDPDKDDLTCGLTKESIDSWASKTLLASGLRISRSAIPRVQVTVTTLYLKAIQLCVSSVHVAVRSVMRLSGGHLPAPAADLVELVSAGHLLSTALPQHRAHMEQAVTEYAEEIATVIRKANQ